MFQFFHLDNTTVFLGVQKKKTNPSWTFVKIAVLEKADR